MKSGSQSFRAARLTTVILGVLIVLFGPLLLLASGWYVQRQEMKERSDELAVYWNRYAASFYEMQGGWGGLEERLQADLLDYPNRTFIVRVFDRKGERMALGSTSSEAQTSSRIRKPIVADDTIIGYTETLLTQQSSIPAVTWLGAIAAFIAGCVVGLLLFMRWRAESSRMLRQIQDRVAAFIPARRSDAHLRPMAQSDAFEQMAATASIQNRLEQDIIQIEDYVRKLETVRRSMVADIAHELRTPLAIMRSQLENALISETPLTLEKTAFMHDELLYLTKLVHDLQELALAEAGKLPLEKSWFSLREASEAVIEALDGEYEEQSLRIELVAPSDVMVYADRIRIRQLIVNLVGNALQHARTRVSVSVIQREGSVIWTVEDDGVGIEEEQLAHLFERFYRNASHPKGTKRRGLGLGLSIVKQYAEAHGGTIEVASVWGEGTTFRLQLPVITA
ncbi:two-component sensor histidine kinase [Paenibacillus sp. CCS19]|uniref:sensor histidine kinase n=1 Tax=Paenibacillus sp. CCS19 TaxID=3158387 RepID=UPI00256BCF84|nr:HAMP domain-containing sensor histidine kinase [Paenibacillus cellulosilyticus]GMK40595.1 two-component sensor histidine kinase [Paenibacillus cellulosilyticus]